MTSLPVEKIRQEFLQGLPLGPVLVTAETGSGKSTQIPRWCAELGPTLVVEPRRVACRSLARYVSELESSPLGARVGYAHRHEQRSSRDTRILFVTPGVALRMFADGALADFRVVILDEFHERTMELDLLLSLLRVGRDPQLVVMSATMRLPRLEHFLEARTLRASGRVHPVEVEFTSCSLLPSDQQLASRTRRAVQRALERSGDVLVFLPGVREIQECLAACQSLPGIERIPLHGGLPSQEQDQAFRPGTTRRVIFATNVAETSITLPRIGVVVDSGLVRRTLYRWGAASLGLVPVAEDAAEQRRGRAGRLGPGFCLRMWSPAGILEGHTPPEIHREPLEDLVLRAGECGVRLADLSMPDPPQPYALEHALEELTHLGAVTPEGRITPRGRKLARLPLPPFLAALLETSRGNPQIQDVIDLVAALSAPPWRIPREQRGDLTEEPCDATALILTMRNPQHVFPEGAPAGLQAALQTARQLRQQEKLPAPPSESVVDRLALARRALEAHPRMGFVRRATGKGKAFANGGSEIMPDRGSALPEASQAMVVLALRAREGRRGTELLATCCIPVPLSFLAEEGLGRKRLARIEKVSGRLESVWETVYAGRVLVREEGTPEGEVLLQAITELILRGSLFPRVRKELEDRLASQSLQRSLEREPPLPEHASEKAWLRVRLEELGVGSQEDLDLLEAEDLLPPRLDPLLQSELDRHYPRRLSLPEGQFSVVYHPAERRLVLIAPRGIQQAPRRLHLPRWEGWKIYCRIKNRETQVLA